MSVTLLPNEKVTAVVAAEDQHGLQCKSRATPLHSKGWLLQMLPCKWQIRYEAKLCMLKIKESEEIKTTGNFIYFFGLIFWH
jgi:hypothetical protein